MPILKARPTLKLPQFFIFKDENLTLTLPFLYHLEFIFSNVN